MFSHRLKQKGKSVWSILGMSHNSNVPRFLSHSNFTWNFWTAGLSCDAAFWETWVFRWTDNLFLLQNALNNWKLVTVGYYSNMVFFNFDRNQHLFRLFPRFSCSQNCHKSSSSRRGCWVFLPLTFLYLLFGFLIFSSPVIQFLICFLSTLNLLAISNIFLSLL